MLAFKLIRDSIKGKLFADWAASVDALAPNFDIPSAEVAKIRNIDWSGASANRNQVFMGALSVDDLLDSTAVYWPAATISVAGASTPGDAKLYARFQGDAVARVEIHYSWLRGRALPNSEDAVDLISAALVRALLDPAWGAALAGGVQWTAEASVTRSSLSEVGENWLQTVTFDMTFHVEE